MARSLSACTIEVRVLLNDVKEQLYPWIDKSPMLPVDAIDGVRNGVLDACRVQRTEI
jgi:hypothetical protein